MPYITREDNKRQIKIHYEVAGDGEPIVLHHGNGNRVQDWYTLGYVEHLAKDFRLIMIDSRGYGKSSKPHDPDAYGLASRAADTIAVLNELSIEKVHCFGGSVGASMGMILAKFYPQRFKSYIFATPYFVQSDDDSKQALLQGAEQYLARIEKLVGAEIKNQEIRQTFLANDTKAVWAANSSEWFDYREYVAYVKLPSLIYVGEEESSINQLKYLSKKLPQNQLHIFPEIDHARLYWNGELVAPIIRDFIYGINNG